MEDYETSTEMTRNSVVEAVKEIGDIQVVCKEHAVEFEDTLNKLALSTPEAYADFLKSQGTVDNVRFAEDGSITGYDKLQRGFLHQLTWSHVDDQNLARLNARIAGTEEQSCLAKKSLVKDRQK